MANSKTPLTVGEDLFVECEIGLDSEIVSYIRESHGIQIKVGAEPFYLWTRVDQGALITKSITTFTTTSPQYSAYIWQPGDALSSHPNARIQENTFSVYNNGTKLTRIVDPGSLDLDTEYALDIERGTGTTTTTDDDSVRIWFNRDFVPSNVAYAYRNICECVDNSTGYPNRECPLCRGTSYPSSFDQYTTDATKYNPVNTILIRVPMFDETLTPEQIGRVRRRDMQHWMELSPIVNNFDLIMGTTGRNAGVLFEITAKRDSRLRGQLMHQEFNTIRIEDSDIRYRLAPVTVSQIISDVVLITSSAEVS